MFHPAVFVFDLELGEEPEGIRPVHMPSEHADAARVPPVAQDRTDYILALPQLARHIVSLHLEAFLVIRPTRSKVGIAYPLAVQPRLVHPQGRRIEPGPPHRSVHVEPFAQEGSRLGPARNLLPAPGLVSVAGYRTCGSPVCVVEVRALPARLVHAARLPRFVDVEGQPLAAFQLRLEPADEPRGQAGPLYLDGQDVLARPQVVL